MSKASALPGLIEVAKDEFRVLKVVVYKNSG